MLTIRYLGLQSYQRTWEAMKSFTLSRNNDTSDELWLLEHHPVFTQGQAGKAKHVLTPKDIPIVYSDRGGQVTYHGPGQLVAYVLMDIRRLNLSIRNLVFQLEHTLISLLKDFDISATSQCKAPGVYVGEKKIASIGLRVKQGCTYHGIALNVDMDLEPFSRINPCGFENLQMTQMKTYVPDVTLMNAQQKFIKYFSNQFDYR